MDAYDTLEDASARLEAGLADAAASAGRTVAIARVGSLLTVSFRERAPINGEEALTSDRDAFARFFRAMLTENVLLPPSPFEAWFVSLAHGDIEIEETVGGRTPGVRRIDRSRRTPPARVPTGARRSRRPSGSCARPAGPSRNTAASANAPD
ncbi:MAG: hypothetical protein WKF78_12495 [Candidatus Limnocylindrales bacterium]